MLGFLLTSVMLVAAFISGCGGNADGRVSATGVVNVDGQPLEEGRIALKPLGPGQPAGSKIQQGKFSISGLLPGKYRVDIRSRRETGKMFTDPDTGKQEALTEQFLPAKYNTRSQEEVDVSSGENNFTFDLEL